MSDTAELVIFCRGMGTTEVNRFTDAVRRADTASEKLIKTTGMLFTTAQLLKFGRASLEAFKGAENASNSLRAALRKLGMENLGYQREMEKFSAQMRDVSVYSKSQITMMQAMGLNMGISAGKIEMATKAALGLSAAYKLNLFTSMRLIARGYHGNTALLARYGIYLDKNKSKEEQFADLVKMGTSNLGLMEAETQTLAGTLTQAGNAFTAAKAKIGEQFAPAVKSVAGVVKDLSMGFVNASEPTQRFIVLTGTLTSAMMALKGAAGAVGIARNIGGMLAGGARTSGNTKNTVNTMLNAGGLAAGREARNAGSLAAVREVKNAGGGDALAIMRQQMQYAEQRKSIEKSIEDAQKRRLQLFNQIKNAEKELAKATEQQALALQRMKNHGEASEIFKWSDKLTLSNRDVNAARIRLDKLDKEFQLVDEEWSRSRSNLNDFDKARAAERNYMLNQPGVRPAMAARESALASGMGAGEAEKTAQQVYALEVEKQARAAELASTAELKRAEALRLGATEAQADAVKTAYLTEQQRAAHLAEKPREAAIKARNAALARGAGVTAAEAAATKAYNQVQSEQAARATMAANAENAKNAALARGATVTQANAVKTAVLAKQQKIAAMQSTAFGRAQLAVAGGVKAAGRAMAGAAVAAKGLMTSMLPMLAISLAIAGIDYLLNRAKNAAKAMSEIAGKEADAARAALARGDEERFSDQEKFKRYEELASYNDRTAEEQKELISLAGELNGRYKDLVLPLLDQNTALEGTVDLWGKIREAQRKAREDQLKEAVRQSNRQLEAEALTLQQSRVNFFGKIAQTLGFNRSGVLGSQGLAERNALKQITALPYQQQLAALETMRNHYKKQNDAEGVNQIDAYIEKLKAARKLQQELVDLRNGRGSLTGGRKAGQTMEESSKESRRLQEMALANEDKRVDEYLSGYNKLREIYNLEGDRAKRKQLISKLNKEELKDYDEEIKLQQKLLNDINKRVKVSGKAEDRQKSVKIAERLADLARQRAEAESNQVRREFEEAQKADQENRQFFGTIQQSLFRFRETATNAISANSNEAIRLQSRQFIGGGEGLNFAKINAENSKKISDIVKKLEDIEVRTYNAIDKIREQVTNNLKTSSVGG